MRPTRINSNQMRITPLLVILAFLFVKHSAFSQTLIDNYKIPNKLGVFIDGCGGDRACDLDYI